MGLAELIPLQLGIQPGTPFEVAIRVKHPGGWHSYWSNPGDSGAPPAISWKLPEGWSASNLIFPTPHLINTSDGGSIFGYDEEAIWFAKITPPSTARIGSTATLNASIRYMICKEECRFEDTKLSAQVEVTSEAIEQPNIDSAIRDAHQSIPKPLKASVQWFKTDEKALSVSFQLLNLGTEAELTLLSADPGVLEPFVDQKMSIENNRVTIRANRSEYSSSVPNKLRAVLIVKWGNQSASYWIEEPVKKT